jgi:hypothetical protein
MKTILITLGLFIIFNSNYALAQEQVDSAGIKLSKITFDYTMNYLGDLRAVIYLYRSEFNKEPGNFEDIYYFVRGYNLNTTFNPADTIQFIPNADGSSIINFKLYSTEDHKHKIDTMLIKYLDGTMNIGAPINKGSSITSLYGKIFSGDIITDFGTTIVLSAANSDIYFNRIPLETLKRIANIKD